MKSCAAIRFTTSGIELRAGSASAAAQEFHVCDPQAGDHDLQRQLAAAFRLLLKRLGRSSAEFAGVGIAYDPAFLAASQPVRNEKSLTRLVSDALGLSAVAEVDVVAAAIAEHQSGAGPSRDPLLLVEAGSRIRAALLIHGQPYRGGGNGEIPLGRLRSTGLPRHVPTGGITVDAIASTTALARRARQAIGDWDSTVAFAQAHAKTSPRQLPIDPAIQQQFHPQGRRFERLLSLADGDPQRITLEAIAQAAQDGDQLSLALLADAAGVLGAAIAQAMLLFQPRRVVIQGELPRTGPELIRQAVRHSVESQFEPNGLPADIILSDQESAALDGAVMLAQGAFVTS